MAGVSNKAIEAQYGELSGSIASQWGEDVMATLDDKLHMSEQTAVQTVSGPVNFSKAGSTHTFVSNIALGGQFINTATFAGLVDMNAGMTVANTATFGSTIITPNSNNLASLLTAEVTQLGNIGTTVSISGTQWGYVGSMDQQMYQTASVTFAGVDLVNNVVEFSTDGTLTGNSDTAVPTEKAVKTYSDLRALWNSDNSAITRYFSDSWWAFGRGVSGIGTWSVDLTNYYIKQVAASSFSKYSIPVNLPHGAVITAVRCTMQKTVGGDTVVFNMTRVPHSSGGPETNMALVAATTSMGERSTTSITNPTIDNDGYSYNIYLWHTDSPTGEARFRAWQIDYTVVRPQP